MKSPSKVPMRHTRALVPFIPMTTQGLTLPPSEVETRDVSAERAEGEIEEATLEREPRVGGD